MNTEHRPHEPSGERISAARLRIENDRLAVEIVRRLAAFLSVTFAVFAAFNLVDLPAHAMLPILLFDIALVVVFGGLWLALRRQRVRPRWAQQIGLGVAVLVLANVLANLGLLGDPFYSLYVVLIVTALGTFMLSTRWFVISVVVVSALWAPVAVRAASADRLVHYTAALGVAIALAAVSHISHQEYRRRLFVLRRVGDRQRERLAASLLESEARYRQIVETAHEGIVIIDTTGALTYVNPRFCEVLGYDAKDVLGGSILDLIAAADRDGVRQRWPERERGISETYECRFLRRDGTEAFCHVSASPIINDQGRHAGSLGLIADISARKAAEDGLRESEERYRRLVEELPDLVYSYSDARGALFWSAAVRKVLGVSPDQVTATPMLWHDAIHPQDLPGVDRAVARFAEGEPYAIEYRIRDTEGRWHWLYDRSIGRQVIGDETIIEGIATDITARKKSEEALQRSEREYRRLFETAHDAIIIFAPEDETVLEANQRACEIYGFERDELIGMSLVELSAEPELGRDKVQETLDALDIQRFESEQRRRDGSPLFLEISASVIDYRGRTAILSLNRDVTERRRTHEVLRKHQRRLETLVNNLPDGVAFLDEEDRVRMTNPRGLQYLEELAGARVGEIVSRIGDHEIDELKRLADEGEPNQLLGVPPRQVFQVVTSSLKEGERSLGSVLVLRDVTRDVETRKRLEQQDRVRAVGQLAAGVAHDFNNILQAITGFAELVKLEADVPPTVAAKVEKIADQGERGARLVRQILDFTRKSITARELVELDGFVTGVIDLLRRTIPESIRIDTAIEPGGHPVEIDRTQIQQLLTNLMVNARDAMPHGGVITVGLARIQIEPGSVPPLEQITPGEWVLLTVADTGIGMADEVRSRVFEPFFTTKEPGKGTGLGLSQAYGITKQHGGFIVVQSVSGGGATFSVYLPPSREETPITSDAPAAGEWRGDGELVLVAEDETMVLEVIRATLEAWGCLVAPAVSGRRALEIYEQSHDAITLVITDVVMPDVGGLEIVRRIRESDPEIPVVLMSGYPLGVEARDVTAAANTAWISKPFRAEQLAQTLAALHPGSDGA